MSVSGERSSSWLASLRFTSVERLPAHSPSSTTVRIYDILTESSPGGRESVNSFGKPPDLGVLVCEALRERSEQRTNKYPEVGGLGFIGGKRANRLAILVRRGGAILLNRSWCLAHLDRDSRHGGHRAILCLDADGDV